jgi:hypothetical protein
VCGEDAVVRLLDGSLDGFGTVNFTVDVAHLVLATCCSDFAVQDGRNFRDGAGRGRGGRGGRTGPRRDYGDADANGGFQGGYGGGGGGGFGGGGVARGGEDGEGRGRGPRQPYRGGGGRRGGYTEGQTTDDYGRPHRSYERRSGTGREYGMKRDGAGRGNWGTVTDEGLPQLRLVMFKLWFHRLLLLFGCDV